MLNDSKKSNSLFSVFLILYFLFTFPYMIWLFWPHHSEKTEAALWMENDPGLSSFIFQINVEIPCEKFYHGKPPLVKIDERFCSARHYQDCFVNLKLPSVPGKAEMIPLHYRFWHCKDQPYPHQVCRSHFDLAIPGHLHSDSQFYGDSLYSHRLQIEEHNQPEEFKMLLRILDYVEKEKLALKETFDNDK